MEKGKVISTAESVGSKEGRGGKLSRLQGVAKETGCGNESLNRMALTPERQISHTWEGLGCWYSTPPPARSGSRATRFLWPARPRVKTSFYSAHPVGRPSRSLLHSLGNRARGQRAHEGAGGSKQRQNGAGVGRVASALPSLGQAPAKHVEGPCSCSRLLRLWISKSGHSALGRARVM